MTDIYHQNELQAFIRDGLPVEWLCLADELQAAAELLWARAEEGLRVEAAPRLDGQVEVKKIASVSRPYILLAGFALENLIKGLLVAADSSLLRTGRVAGQLKSHRLLDLVRGLPGLTLSADEVAFCKLAQEAIPYWGRYPIPLTSQGLLPESALTPERRATYLSLHQRLGQSLYDRIKDGWDSGAGPKTVKIRARRYGGEIKLDEPIS